MLRIEYWPKSLKIAKIIMIPKPGKSPMDEITITILILKKSIKTCTPKTGSQTINLDSEGSLHSATMPPHNRCYQ